MDICPKCDNTGAYISSWSGKLKTCSCTRGRMSEEGARLSRQDYPNAPQKPAYGHDLSPGGYFRA